MTLSTVQPDSGSEPDESWEMDTNTLSPLSAVSKTLRSGHDGGVALPPCDVEGEVVSMALEEPDLLFFAVGLRPGAAFWDADCRLHWTLKPGWWWLHCLMVRGPQMDPQQPTRETQDVAQIPAQD